MSAEYPCIYFEKDGKCRKFSDDTYISYCVMGPCPEQKLSNADRIRAMSDEELEDQLVLEVEGIAPCKMFIAIPTGEMFISRKAAKESVGNWLKQPLEEE